MAVGFWGITVAQFSVPGQKVIAFLGVAVRKKNGKKWKKEALSAPKR